MIGISDSHRRRFWKQGEPLVWLTGAALTITLLMTLALVGVVLVNGLGNFWPSDLRAYTMNDGGIWLGRVADEEHMTVWRPAGEEGELEPVEVERVLVKTGNRDLYGTDFRWIEENDVAAVNVPPGVVALERMEYGDFYGFIERVEAEGLRVPAGTEGWEALEGALAALEPLEEVVDDLRDEMADLSTEIEEGRLEIQRYRYEIAHDEAKAERLGARIAAVETRVGTLETEFEALNASLSERMAALGSHGVVMRDAAGTTKTLALTGIVRAWRPNDMGTAGKLTFYGRKVVDLLTEEPREANTEGGLMPAIFGTVMLVLLMSLFCIPLGVMAAVYLREYAKEGIMVRLVRVAVNNLAGVPSIVYGIFGLGFFVYGMGGAIDRVFFPERLPTPTFGTGGLLWASLTLALLTVPVVIVATEEALASVPRGIREGSLALGATKLQTLVRILLPMASPGIMTGFILAMARAAGEVAPLMIVGVVKLAPSLPLDGNAPFLHLERKFMHLGFHIYDVGFQSPNVEAAKPMVYVTALLLLVIVIVMSSLAMWLRNRMKARYTTGAF